MTTLRRELKARLTEVLDNHYRDNPLNAEVAEELVDAALEVGGFARKFKDPAWDLLHGKIPDAESVELARRAELYKVIAERLERGLRRGEFPQTPDAQRVYRWIAEREAAGESLDKFIAWATFDKRAEYTFIYHKDPNLIKRDWPQAFTPGHIHSRSLPEVIRD